MKINSNKSFKIVITVLYDTSKSEEVKEQPIWFNDIGFFEKYLFCSIKYTKWNLFTTIRKYIF